MRAIVKMKVSPGGQVEVLGVTDKQGKALTTSKCKSVVLEVGASLGKVQAASVKAVQHTSSKAETDLEIGL